jgi:hypothetical protein
MLHTQHSGQPHRNSSLSMVDTHSNKKGRMVTLNCGHNGSYSHSEFLIITEELKIAKFM